MPRAQGDILLHHPEQPRACRPSRAHVGKSRAGIEVGDGVDIDEAEAVVRRRMDNSPPDGRITATVAPTCAARAPTMVAGSVRHALGQRP